MQEYDIEYIIDSFGGISIVRIPKGCSLKERKKILDESKFFQN